MYEKGEYYAINFPTVVKTSSAITGCFERTVILYMPRARQQSFYSTGFSCFRFRYIIYGHTNSKSIDQPGKVANTARGQLNRENEYFLVRVHA